MAREKLTQEMVDLAIQYKGEGCTNGDIICMLGVAESTFYRWTCHPRGKLQRALSEGLRNPPRQKEYRPRRACEVLVARTRFEPAISALRVSFPA